MAHKYRLDIKMDIMLVDEKYPEPATKRKCKSQPIGEMITLTGNKQRIKDELAKKIDAMTDMLNKINRGEDDEVFIKAGHESF